MKSRGSAHRYSVRVVVLLILLLSGAAAVLLIWPQRRAPSLQHLTESFPSQEPGHPEARSRDPVAGFIGVVMARESVEVASPLEARLAQVLVNLGDHVRFNATLATLDSAPLRQELAMAEASLRAAEAELSRAESLLEEARRRRSRVDSLGEFVADEDRTSAELDEKLAVSAFETSRAHVDKEMAGVQRLRETLAGTEVRAPFDGTIAARFQDPGTMLHPGSPIVRVIRSGDLWVRFAVPETERSGITSGMTVTVNIENVGSPVPAVVEQIAPEVDTASRMVIVEARLGIPATVKQAIQSGLTCRVSLAGTGRGNAGGT